MEIGYYALTLKSTGKIVAGYFNGEKLFFNTEDGAFSCPMEEFENIAFDIVRHMKSIDDKPEPILYAEIYYNGALVESTEYKTVLISDDSYLLYSGIEGNELVACVPVTDLVIFKTR